MKKVVLSLMFLVVLVSGCKRDITVSGFKLGQEIDVQDEDIRTTYSLGKPQKINWSDAEYSCDKCEVLEVDDDFDKVNIFVSEGKKIVAFGCEKRFSTYANARLGLDEMFREFKEKYAKQLMKNPPSDEAEYSCRMEDGSRAVWMLADNSRTLTFMYCSKEFILMYELDTKNRQNRLEAEEMEMQRRMAIEKLNRRLVSAAEGKAMRSLEYYYTEENVPDVEARLDAIIGELKATFHKVDTTDEELKEEMRAVEQFYDNERDNIIKDRKKYNAQKRERGFDYNRQIRKKRHFELEDRLARKLNQLHDAFRQSGNDEDK